MNDEGGPRAPMMTESRPRVAVLATDGVERVELEEPLRVLHMAGARSTLVADHAGTIQTYDHLDPVTVQHVDLELASARPDDFDALVLPGGVANPDTLRRNPAAVAFVADVFAAGKPVAAICHAPWLLIEAGVARGRSVTSWPSLRTDLLNAGATWLDREVVRDGNLLTSRGPDDLGAFSAALLTMIHGGIPPEEVVDHTLEESFPASDPPSLANPSIAR